MQETTTPIQNHFILENFQGPIDLLFLLVQKKELLLFDIPLIEILDQFIAYYKKIDIALEENGDTIAFIAQLIYLKSLLLLPQDTTTLVDDIEIEEATLLKYIIEYATFRKASELFTLHEEQTAASFKRKPEQYLPEERSLKKIPLDVLKEELLRLLKKNTAGIQSIKTDPWLLEDTICFIKKNVLQSHIKVASLLLQKTKSELIVLFLAILELLKSQEILLTENDGNLVIATKGQFTCLN